MQHEATLDARVRVTTGLKAETNAFTGLELQPNVRLLWNPRRTHTLWAAATRAVRIPSIADRGGLIPVYAGPGPGGLLAVACYEGSTAAEAEVLHAYEAGYRLQAACVRLPRLRSAGLMYRFRARAW